MQRIPGRRRGRMLVTSLAVGLMATSLVSGPVSGQGASIDPTICAGKKVALTSTQARGDNSVVDDTFNGLERTKAELGVAATTFVEALDPATYEATLTNLASAGNDIVIGEFPGFTESIKTVAAQFPNVRFVHLYADPVDPPIPNLRTVSYDYYLAAYLAGIMAAAISNTGTLGFESGVFIPGINADFWGFKAGAETVNQAIKVIAGEVGSFSDDAKAKEVVSAIIAKGADVVFGDGPNVGLIEAAKEKGAYVLMGTKNLVAQAPDLIPGIPFVSFGKSTFDEVAAACAADWTGGHDKSGLGGAIDFFVSDMFAAAGDPAVVAKVNAILPIIEKAKADIMSGVVKVPFVIDNPK